MQHARVIGFVLVGISSALSVGCMLIGAGVGTVVDRRAKDVPVMPGLRIESIGPGVPATVWLTDGRQITGTFAGLMPVPAEDYARDYEASRHGNGAAAALPSLGPGATLSQKGRERRCELLGVEYGGVIVRGDGERKPSRLRFDMVERIADGQGRALTGPQLARLAAEGDVPLMSMIAVDTPAGRTQVAMGDVVRMDIKPKRHGMLVGFLVGAAIDAAVIAIAVSSLNDWGDWSETSTAASCPFVYSFDGQRYVLDSEVFGGALFAASPRTDRARLPHLVEASGSYRVRLTNELAEIQYVDEVALLAVDHPRGTEVAALASGELLALSSPVPPRRAIDLGGANVLALLAGAEEEWVSRPPLPGSAANRDGVELEFPRPPGVAFAKVVVDTRATAWASSLLRSVLGLRGRDLGAWYARMERDRAGRHAFEGAIRREGMLSVSLWDGRRWRPAGFLAAMSGGVARRQAVRLDLGAAPGDTLRVRLESTAGLWTLAHAAADFSPDVPLAVTRIPTAVAEGIRDGDVRGLLARRDGREYAMQPGQDQVELTFVAPPAKEGRDRSLLLDITGHYTVLVPSRAAPQAALFAHVVGRPGAFGEYSRQLLERGLARELAELDSTAAPED